VRTQGVVRLKLACLPSALPVLAPHLDRLGGRFAWYGSLGIGFASLDEVAPAELIAVREILVAMGGSLVIQAGPASLRAQVDPWGPVPGLDLMLRVKRELDPSGRLNPGRFAGGL